jgi:cell division transport system permease protein
VQKINSRRKLGSYPSVGVVLSITLALFVIGLFGMLIISARQFEKIVRENIRVEVYLKNDLTEPQRLQVQKNLESLPYVNKQTPQSSVRFVSKEEAAKDFKEEIEFLGDNPLRDAFLISVDPKYHTNPSMERIKKEVGKMNGVFQVIPKQGLIDDVNRNVSNIGLVLAGLVGLLLFVVVLLINNTLRLALFSQRFLIRSMQLVGARKWFIQRPFVFRAFGYGILAGVLASGGIWGVINYANKKIEDLVILEDKDSMLILMGSLLLVGAFVAVTSTFIAIRKYLRMSLDDLF